MPDYFRQIASFGSIPGEARDRNLRERATNAQISRNESLSDLALAKQRLASDKFKSDEQKGRRKAAGEFIGRAAVAALQAPPEQRQELFGTVWSDPSVSELFQGDDAGLGFVNDKFIPALADDNALKAIATHFGQEVPERKFDTRAGVGPDGQPMFGRIDQSTGEVIPVEGMQPQPERGTSIQVTQDGVNVDLDGGAGRSIPLSSSTANKVQGNVLDLQGVRDTLTTIQQQFQPKFQQFSTRGDIAALRLKVKASGAEGLEPEQRQLLEDYSAFRANTAENLAASIKLLSGTAASDREVVRLLGFLPDAGDGIFDGDDEVTFQSKLNEATRRVNRALARAQYALVNGIAVGANGQLDGEALSRHIPLSSVDALVDERGAEIERGILAENPDIKAAELKAQVRGQLRGEFGIQ